MYKTIRKILLSIGLIAVITPVYAEDILEVFNQAVHSDPTYQAAVTTRLANREALPQSIAGLLPNLSATAYGNYNRMYTIASTPATGVPPGVETYNTGGYTVNVTQPLIAPITWMQVRAAAATSKQADATLGAAAQDLIIRVAEAYFNVLQSQDNLRYTQAQKAANARQLDQVKERYKVGLDSITSVYNAQASYDTVSASEFGAQNDLKNALEALRQLTGQDITQVEAFKIELPLINPDPMDVNRWVEAAERQNLSLWAQRFALDSAREVVKVNAAGHLPTISAVGTFQRAAGQSFGELDYYQGTAGLQLNLPIYQGGLINSQIRQAEANYATAASNMEDTHRQVVVAARQKFNDVLTGLSQVRADRVAIISSQSSVDSTEESFKVGTRTIVDVLIAQNNLYQAKFTYAKDQYSYLLSTLQLKQAAGTLGPHDLEAINVWLHEPCHLFMPHIVHPPEDAPPPVTHVHHKKVVHKTKTTKKVKHTKAEHAKAKHAKAKHHKTHDTDQSLADEQNM